MPWDYEGDTAEKFCNRCKRITKHTCFRGSFSGTLDWCCDDCERTMTCVIPAWQTLEVVDVSKLKARREIRRGEV